MTCINGDVSPFRQRETSPLAEIVKSASVIVMSEQETDDPFVLGLKVVMQKMGRKPAPLSEAAGLGTTAVRDLFRKGSSPKMTTAAALARTLGTTIDEIIAAGENHGAHVLHTEVQPASTDNALIPIYDISASAGYGALAGDEEIIDRLAFPPAYLRQITTSHPSNLAIISVKGDSMLPTLSPEDLVMIDMSKRDLSFDGIFVIRDEGASLLVKRIGRGTRRGHIMMVSDNQRYPPAERALTDIECIGKVLWMGVKV